MMNASYVPSFSVDIGVARVDARNLRTMLMRVSAHPMIFA
jgi:hypothetical protein